MQKRRNTDKNFQVTAVPFLLGSWGVGIVTGVFIPSVVLTLLCALLVLTKQMKII